MSMVKLAKKNNLKMIYVKFSQRLNPNSSKTQKTSDLKRNNDGIKKLENKIKGDVKCKQVNKLQFKNQG